MDCACPLSAKELILPFICWSVGTGCAYETHEERDKERGRQRGSSPPSLMGLSGCMGERASCLGKLSIAHVVIDWKSVPDWNDVHL